MSEIVRTVIIMSITGSILAGFLLITKPLLRDRLPKSTQYYLWLVVIMALLVPVSQIIVLPDNPTADVTAAPIPVLPAFPMPQAVISETVSRFVITQAEETERLQNISHLANIDASRYTQERDAMQSPLAFVTTYFVMIYPVGVGVMLLWYVFSYLYYARLLRRRNMLAIGEYQEILLQLSPKPPRLFFNRLATTPMLLGIFRPQIILPDRDYTYGQLYAILAHELTHLRRKDIFVKWLMLAASALHWFNPLMWLIRREIDRTCELSCDEAVIRNMDAEGKRDYGHTLISVSARSKTTRVVASATMCEEKKNLKERLGAIMKSKKHARVAVVFSALLIFLTACGAFALGAGRGNNDNAANSYPYQQEDNGYPTENGIINGAENVRQGIPELVWVVQPTLEYEYIKLCSCGYFFTTNWTLLDSVTGLVREDWDGAHGHGGPPPSWVYDPQLGLFGHSGKFEGYNTNIGMHPLEELDDVILGMFPFSEFMSDWMMQSSREFIIVEAVDSSQRVTDNEWLREGEWMLAENGYSGTFALMYNRELITDFIFNGGIQMRRDFVIAHDFPLASMHIGGVWGLVDINGDVVLPFIFENLLPIDATTAFARYNGRYGILDLTRTLAGVR